MAWVVLKGRSGHHPLMEERGKREVDIEEHRGKVPERMPNLPQARSAAVRAQERKEGGVRDCGGWD